MEIFNNIFNFITDNTKNLGQKALIVFALIFVLYLADNILGFTYYSNLDDKLKVISNINSALKEPTITNSEKSKLLQLRNTTLNRKSLKDIMFDFVTDFSISDKEIVKGENVTIIYQGNDTLQFVSSTWMFLLACCITPFVKYEGSWLRKIGMLILMESAMLTVAFLFNKLLSLIPVIDNNIYNNYLLFAIINLVILGWVVRKTQQK